MQWVRFWLGLGLVGASGCGSEECTKEAVVPSYRIAVIDAKTHAPICDATLTPKPRIADCTYVIDKPSPMTGPTTDVTAAHTGYAPTTIHPSTGYSTDHCNHAIPEDLQIELTPQ